MKTKITYNGTAPGADTNTYVLLNTTLLVGAGKFSLANLPWVCRLMISIKNVAAGTLKLFASEDNGTTWTQVMADVSVAAVGTTASANTYDLLIGEYRDVKVEWVNGGSAQTVWRVDMAFLPAQVTAI